MIPMALSNIATPDLLNPSYFLHFSNSSIAISLFVNRLFVLPVTSVSSQSPLRSARLPLCDKDIKKIGEKNENFISNYHIVNVIIF